MYIPEPFKVVDEREIEAFIQRYDFATIVSATPDGLMATHVPVSVDRDDSGLVIRGHLARGNPHWKSMDGAVDALMIFHGPHGYVSPSWYASSPAVPTWNYAVVHAHGRPRIVEDHSFTEDVLNGLLRRYEEGRPNAWRFDVLPEDFRRRQLSAIVGFEMPVVRLEAKFKLGQNRAASDRAGAMNGLEQEHTAEASALAAFMRTHVKDGI
jgi:transcriptional regulator